MIPDPFTPPPRGGGFGEELARFTAANQSIARHRRRWRWLRLRAAVFGRPKRKVARLEKLPKLATTCECRAV